MHHYTAYGLNITAEFPFPELAQVDVAQQAFAADVSIRFGRLDFAPQEVDASDLRAIRMTDEGIYLYWVDVGAFLVRGGAEVIVDPAPGATEDLLRLFVLGTTFAMLLHQRGETAVFHASSVAIAGQAVAFVGIKGAGKSTMAATLSSRGHDLVSDDIVAVNLQANPPTAVPGFPHLKLWPDAVAALGQQPDALPRLRPELDKRGYRLRPPRFRQRGIPIKYLYLLCVGETLEVTPIPQRQALLTLLPHWYGARFTPEVLQALGNADHFLECAALVQSVPVYRLQRPAALERLPDVARLVEDHVLAEIGEEEHSA